MTQKTFIFIFILLTSCAIEEIPRQPLLATPLGLGVKRVPESGGIKGLGMFFTSNNPEIFFTGYSVFVSTQKEDFGDFLDGEVFFPLIPTDVPGSKAQLLTNYNDASAIPDQLTIYRSQMSFPDKNYYPPTGPDGNLVLEPGTPDEDPVFTSTSFTALPNGDPFAPDTTYYFGAYAYSSVDDVYSLPSNIAEIKYP